MEQQEKIADSPTGWVADHIRTYVESAGAEGHDFNGFATLLLTTRGRRSGLLRRTALIYGRDGEEYVLVASNGGEPKHPLWYLNLTAEPQVEIQVGAQRFSARARTAGPDRRPALWQRMTELFEPYSNYQTGNPREIPIVLLEVTEELESAVPAEQAAPVGQDERKEKQ
ncbi:nitroreductase family deazaflavin-dependent oxidoreductase [Streptomyces sp. NPDC051561]|uniref:nitroreductase family deazaflavin-dependent oxidoreductase n=1 Tax=Streptomyces sp. NPDC051561 TaxID=3365658 RepID=UPI0037A4693E